MMWCWSSTSLMVDWSKSWLCGVGLERSSSRKIGCCSSPIGKLDARLTRSRPVRISPVRRMVVVRME